MEIKVGDSIFLDTNVLLSASDRSRAGHVEARRLLSLATGRGLHPGISGQVFREYLVVATRPPEVNGLGLSPTDALSNIQTLRRRLVFHEETKAVSNRLLALIDTYGLQGKRIHDANIVATLLTYGMSKLVTQNPSDFACFGEIETTSVTEVLAAITGED